MQLKSDLLSAIEKLDTAKKTKKRTIFTFSWRDNKIYFSVS